MQTPGSMCQNVLNDETRSIIPIVQVFDSMPFMFFRNAGKACPHYVYPSLLQSAKNNPCVIFVGNEACRSTVESISNDRELLKEGHEVVFQSIRNVLYANAIDELYRKFPHHWFPYFKRYYEFLCFVRFYVLRAMMNKFQLKHVFYQDSDTLLFANVTRMVQLIEQQPHSTIAPVAAPIAATGDQKEGEQPAKRTFVSPLDVGLTTDQSAFTSGHFSLFSQAGITDAINFLEEFFSKHSITTMQHFSDMTALNLFIFSSIPKESRWCKHYMEYEYRCGEHERLVQPPLTYQRTTKVLSLSHPPIVLSEQESGFFDLNYVAGDVHWNNGVPYKKGTKLQYFAIHFQGNKKWYIKRYTDLPACSKGKQCTCEGVKCSHCQSCSNWN